MKKFLPVILLSISALNTSAQQQIGNGGMENWEVITGSSVEPTNWNSFLTAGGSVSWAASDQVAKSTDVHSGSFSCRINAKSTLGVIANGNLTVGKINMGNASPTNASNYNSTIQGDANFSEAFTDHPDSLVFWVKFVPASGNNTDSARVAAFIHDDYAFQDGAGGSPYAASAPHMVAKAIKNFANTANSWVRMSVPWNYAGPSTTIQYLLITFSTNKTPGGGSNNDYLYIDDVTLIYNPVALPDAASVIEGMSVDVNVAANDSDVDGVMDNSTITVTANPAHGSTSVNTSNGHITYTSNAGFHGTDSFIYRIYNQDSPAASDTAVVYINVNGQIVAMNDAVTTSQDTPVDIPVASNDSDPENSINLSSVTIITQPANGTLNVNNGVVTYTPGAGYFGTDMFTYAVSDNGTPASSDTATVNITVNEVIAGQNNPIITNNDAATTSENNAVTIDVLANDVDPENQIDVNSLAIVTNPSSGTVNINGSHQIVYTPNNGFSGTDSFTYTVCDLGTPTTCDTATVSITITSNLGIGEVELTGIHFGISNGKLMVFNAENTSGTIKVYANSGQLILSAPVQSSYDFNAEKGVYFVVFEGNDLILNQKIYNY